MSQHQRHDGRSSCPSQRPGRHRSSHIDGDSRGGARDPHEGHLLADGDVLDNLSVGVFADDPPFGVIIIKWLAG
ncbi:MAG: hypothetical protein ACJAR2_003433 [Ilumatobacter sp.]